MAPIDASSPGGPAIDRSDGCPGAGVTGDEALYLFCLAWADAVSEIEGPGMDADRPDWPLQLLRVRDVVAIVSRVSLAEFSGVEACRRMATLSWMAPRAWRHEEVIEGVMRRSPVVPARFSTLFSSPARLTEWIEGRYRDVCRALDRFAGQEEWSVKAVLLVARAEDHLMAEAMAMATPAPSSGARYLQERRIRSGIAEVLDARVIAARGSIARELLQHAAEHRECRVVPQMQDAGASFANWAFLVSREKVAAFLACVKGINDTFAPQGISLDVSGPWPPYRFGSALGESDSA